MHQLTNLTALEELDLQYNNMDELQIPQDAFPCIHTLHLSFNRIPREHLCTLGNLQSLQVLNLAANNLSYLPSDLSFFHSLQELNLSQNNFGDDSQDMGPGKNVGAIFRALTSIPLLRKLNLSRNKLSHFHTEHLPEQNQRHNAQL